MNLAEIKQQALFQYNNDTDAMDDYEFMPHINDYANEAYDKLLWHWKESALPPFMRLEKDTDVPVLVPDWAHRALSDYVTWLLYRNGSSARQNRGQVYLQNFLEFARRLKQMNGGGVKNFFNIPE